MINLKTLVAVSNAAISTMTRPDIDIRTIRYYQTTERLMGKIRRSGRENMYDEDNLKRLILIKYYQTQGLSLAQIKENFKNDIDEQLSAARFDIRVISDMFSEAEKNQPPKREEEEEEKVSSKSRKSRKFAKRPEVFKSPGAFEYPLQTQDTLSVEITNGQEYALVRDFVRLGTAFAFINGLTGDGAKKTHALLNGQKAGAGEVNTAIIPVEDAVYLPGCTIKNKPVSRGAISVILPDKDIYKEGDGVARLFIFDPTAKGTEQAVLISLDGASLDRIETKLDENGCAMVRFATLVSGNYEARLENRPGRCDFHCGRYELAPFTVNIKSMQGKGDKLTVELVAETFGSPYEGKVEVRVTDASIGLSRDMQPVNFKDGEATAEIDLSGVVGFAILVFHEPKMNQVASTPILGSRKEERDETTVSNMGPIYTVSLMPSKFAQRERGLNFESTTRNNAAISLEKCVCKSIVLDFNQDAEDVVVFMRNPVTGKSTITELGDCKRGDSKTEEFDGPAVVLHVGAFVDGKSWEGHGTVVKSVAGSVDLKAPESIEPGEKLSLAIRTPARASVMVKVVDKRLRAKDEPLLAAAAKLKAWLAEIVGTRACGFIGVPMPILHLIHPSLGGILRGFTGPAGPTGPVGLFGSSGGAIFGSSAPLGGLTNAPIWSSTSDLGGGGGYSVGHADNTLYTMRADSESPISASYYRSDPLPRGIPEKGLVSKSFVPEEHGGQAAAYQDDVSMSMVDAVQAGGEVKTSGGILLADTAVERREAQGKPKIRKSEADVIYCDLITVDREKTIEIKLPDVVGYYDIRVFAVMGDDWAEAETSLRVEKEMYVEPLIPQFAHPEDGIRARAVVVRAREDAMFTVRLDGKPVKFESKRIGENVHLSWDALPGVHEVSVVSKGIADKVARVVEQPGEEIVLTQELMILKRGRKFDISKEEALSARVVPSIDSELHAAVWVCADYQHSCCEQTSGKIVAACFALVGGDDSSRDKAKLAIINGEARLRSMFVPGQGFCYYPGGSVSEWASQIAATRVSRITAALDAPHLPADVRRAIKSLSDMAEEVMKIHKGPPAGFEGFGGAQMETAYFDPKHRITEAEVAAVIKGLKEQPCYFKAEACYCAATLLRDGRIEEGIEAANTATKAMGSANGGGFFGTVEMLAYVYLVDEMRKAGIVVGGAGTSVTVDGKKMTVAEAAKVFDAGVIEATSPVAIRVNRIEKIRFGDTRATLPITVSLKGEEREIRAGRTAKLVVKVDGGYKAGDVLCVSLPNCLAQIIGGASARKIQLDFAGKDTLEVELVATSMTEKPQRWAAVVRNMYDTSRIGSVGEMKVEVA